MNNKIINLKIAGMHCKSCEVLLEDQLKEIEGVNKVKISYKNGTGVLQCSGEVSMSKIEDIIKKAGYNIGGEQNNNWLSHSWFNYKNLLISAVILFIIYIIAKGSGLLLFEVNSAKMGLGVVFTVGLVAGISTCMALVGGLVLALSSRHNELHTSATAIQKFRPHLLFNTGRVLGFFLLGGLFGLIGSGLKMSVGVLGFMTILVGMIMLLLGLKMIEIFPRLQQWNFTLPKFIARTFGINKKSTEYSHKGAILSGALTFFLPCGFTQAMQLYAISLGSFWQGGLVMGLFALGTIPGLLGIGGLTSFFKGKKAKLFYVTAGLAVILLGGVNIANGSRLISFKTIDSSVNRSGIIKDSEYQVITMTQKSNGYSPSVLYAQKGVPIKWVINSETSFSCASYLVVPQYGISKNLKKGENIITFTPTENGVINFSCSMGMYRGQFIVSDSEGEIVSNNQDTVSQNYNSYKSCSLNGCN